jgi:hypothetical protein
MAQQEMVGELHSLHRAILRASDIGIIQRMSISSQFFLHFLFPKPEFQDKVATLL